ncbi:putative pre-rrna-processing protein pno1 [Diaporthe ampelina]|uniref:Pre-rRNA-processing protein PNO1 n=1 Tax=Diaporthe ampelina TaxID=1214573 RepID=A0A0G2HPI1_9PEZI|nr:putative pre-rrna-processing protein pno1 [Diaporthe ampelina]
MPAPTALKAALEEPAANIPLPADSQDDDILIDAPGGAAAAPAETEGEAAQQPETDMQLDDAVDEEGRPRFAPSSARGEAVRVEHRKVPIPPHRMTPLKASWPKIYPPLVEHLKLQCRMNMKSKAVELRTSKATTDNGAIQKGADFVRAFALGFDVDDAIALLRMDDLYIETFEIKDVKTLQGDHLARAIGRIAGKDGKTRYAIENASRTRVVLADSKIHILGAFKNTRIARESIVSLILGKPPGKVYNGLRTVSARMKERF